MAPTGPAGYAGATRERRVIVDMPDGRQLSLTMDESVQMREKLLEAELALLTR